MAKQRSRAFWEQTLADYERQPKGQSLTEFARARGLVPGSLYRWRARLEREREAESQPVTTVAARVEPEPSFIPLVLREASTTPAVRVCLTTPPTLEVLAPERAPVDWLVELSRALTEVSS